MTEEEKDSALAELLTSQPHPRKSENDNEFSAEWIDETRFINEINRTE